jgi:membrane protein implicated in regulation of membrane protease activity
MLGVLDLGIDLDAWPWIWLIIAVVFALIELTVVGGSFIILPWAVSAFVTAILAFYDVQIEIQWAVFVFGGLILFGVLYRWAQGFMRNHPMAPGVGAERLVGLVGIVTTPIDPVDTDRRGRVTVESEVWGVVEPPRAFDRGEHVRITGMKGTRVTIEPVDPDDNDISDSPTESDQRE